MIGIPPAGTPEFDTFSISFWAALYSGLIYSFFTGIIVGLVVWGLQKHAEKRALCKIYDAELLRLLDNLRRIDYNQDVLKIDNALSSIPDAANEVMRLIDSIPLLDWQKNLPKHKHIIETIINVKKTKDTFTHAAQQLDLRLRQFIRNHHGTKTHISNDATHISHFIGRTHGRTYAAIAQWLHSGNEETLNASYEAAQNDPGILETLNPYMESRKSLIHTLHLLRDELTKS